MLKPLFGAVCALTLLIAGSTLAQVQLPPGSVRPNQPTLPEGVRPNIPLTPTCHVDLAITSATLTKGARPGYASVAYEIHSVGRRGWSSSAGQQVTNLVVRNGNTGSEFTMSVPIGARRYGVGERVAIVRSSVIRDAFDTHEFSGTVNMDIVFDPDIATDANLCNDDANAANNRFAVTSAQVQGFLAGAARSQTFRP